MRRTLVLGLLAGLCIPVTSAAATRPAPPRAASSGATPPPPATAKRRLAIDDPALRDQMLRSSSRRPDGPSPTLDVEILHDGDESDVSARVVELGGSVTGHAPSTIVQARMPVATLPALASTPGIAFVRRPVAVNRRPGPDAVALSGPVTTEAVSIMNAAAWHSAGSTGAGVRIGIIDFFNESKWTTQVHADEVPAVSGTFCLAEGAPCSVWDPGETGHGNAVAEVIHDLAPDAEIFLGQAGTINDSYALVDWFVANGVTIVNRSLGSSYDGPGDGTGPLDELVDFAAARGITWFNSAGNEGFRRYWRGPSTDADGDGWIEFGPGDESLGVSGDGGCLSVLGARWNDWGPASQRTDYDFYIFAGEQQVFPPSGDDGPDQQLGAPPIELDGIEGCEPDPAPLSIRVKQWAEGSGAGGDVLEVLMYSGDLEYSQSAGSAAGPIVDSRNRAVLAVGAIDPPTTGGIAYYSSQGPTNDGRRKPDLSAPSCFTSSIYRLLSSCFNGTSAASPAAAGMAAVVRSAGLASTPQGLAALVKHLVVDRGAPGPDSTFGTGEARLPAPVVGAVDARPSVFVGLTPTRVVDTRRAIGPLGRALGTEEILDVPMAGVGPVPAGATSVAMNVTVVGAVTQGYIQVLPTMFAPIDASSSLNLESAGQVLPNFLITPIGGDGRISVYAPSGGDLLIDVLGYFLPAEASAAGRLVPVSPTRVLDTRQPVSLRPDILPSGWVDHRPAGAEVVPVEFRAGSGVPTSGVAAVVLNVTATAAAGVGYVTAYPSGGVVPDASVLNLVGGATNANTVVVPLGPDRRVGLYTSVGAHLIVDVAGYFTDATTPSTTSGRFTPVSPARIVDTRSSGAPLVSGEARSLVVGGLAGIPGVGADAVSFNVTATGTTGSDGYVQLWPTGSPVTTEFSNVNWTATGQTVASGGIVKIGAGAGIDARSYQGAHLILDVNGYFTS